MASIGEQAVNMIVEKAIAAQLDDVDRLDVQIKTDPSRLAHGELEQVAISGEGLVVQSDLRLESFEMQINEISVKPLSALLGKIELLHPTEGKVQIILTEVDLNHAFNLSNINQELIASLEWVTLRSLDCQLKENERIAINLKVDSPEISFDQALPEDGLDIQFSVIPIFRQNLSRINLDKVEYATGEGLFPHLQQIIINKLDEILNLSTFQLEGMELQIQQFSICDQQISLQADIQVNKIPTN